MTDLFAHATDKYSYLFVVFPQGSVIQKAR